MEWKTYQAIEHAELIVDEEKDEVTLHCLVLGGANLFKKLMDNATQATLDFDGGAVDGESVIGFRLRNANGEFYLGFKKGDWFLLQEQPDKVAFQYGEGEKQHFETVFLNLVFDQFIDEVIEKYNAGNKDLFTVDMIDVFAEED